MTALEQYLHEENKRLKKELDEALRREGILEGRVAVLRERYYMLKTTAPKGTDKQKGGNCAYTN